jgi:hypothetical protein
MILIRYKNSNPLYSGDSAAGGGGVLMMAMLSEPLTPAEYADNTDGFYELRSMYSRDFRQRRHFVTSRGKGVAKNFGF